MNCHFEGCLEKVVKVQKACKCHRKACKCHRKSCGHNDGKAYCAKHFISHILSFSPNRLCKFSVL